MKKEATPVNNQLQKGEVLQIPIAHGEGNYFCDPSTLQCLKDNNQILFTYCGPGGEEEDIHNPNGSLANIAGICNRKGNVLGMMPHPERCSEEVLGGTDGLKIFTSMLKWCQEVRL